MTAATSTWTKPEDMTAEHKALRPIARWKCLEVQTDGMMKAVNEIDGTLGMFTPYVITHQGLEVGDVSEVREGVTRDLDVVILYKAGVKYES